MMMMMMRQHAHHHHLPTRRALWMDDESPHPSSLLPRWARVRVGRRKCMQLQEGITDPLPFSLHNRIGGDGAMPPPRQAGTPAQQRQPPS
jgi:hypothetical protein